MKLFEEFLEQGIITKQSPDLSRAKSLKEESKKSYEFLKEIIKKIGISNNNANMIIKLCYDTILDLIRSKMIEKGFNATGRGAHEAEVSYLRELKFNEHDIEFTD